MPDKGKVMSQTYYEKQSKLFKLYQESFDRNELDVKEAITTLKMIGFSESIAATRVAEWKGQHNTREQETDREKKQRLKEQASLEKYILRMRLGKDKYEEYMILHSKK